ncbi:hypothetical protein NOS3756_57870 (plasmid) [Nostoc sp. NIES-3756]|uniref:hypothetical protein n=1 Tax=Nostoc sp. NIES-3756 TaxID=1751286 RepID=UPI00071F5B03|nr:hypothetical protein [Nostoc sp. NIES-3756]BAT56775.1 hypothetical protein NOS3756_57870 [Nostoc sp. NIES-3756]BAY41550.1 hypothetical protein NIES2111_59460 [Nostoc sp. NIES-2111]
MINIYGAIHVCQFFSNWSLTLKTNLLWQEAMNLSIIALKTLNAISPNKDICPDDAFVFRRA